MSATPDIFTLVRAAGGRVLMVEDRLKVRAPLPLPDELVAELRLHKAEVLAFLQDKKSAWTSGDWRAFYEERAAIAEHDGGLPRAAAEQQALGGCLVEWMRRNPPPASGPKRCAHCGELLGEPGRDGLPYFTGDGGQVCLHSGCHSDWIAQCRAEAMAALEILGRLIQKSSGHM